MDTQRVTVDEDVWTHVVAIEADFGEKVTKVNGRNASDGVGKPAKRRIIDSAKATDKERVSLLLVQEAVYILVSEVEDVKK